MAAGPLLDGFGRHPQAQIKNFIFSIKTKAKEIFPVNAPPIAAWLKFAVFLYLARPLKNTLYGL